MKPYYKVSLIPVTVYRKVWFIMVLPVQQQSFCNRTGLKTTSFAYKTKSSWKHQCQITSDPDIITDVSV